MLPRLLCVLSLAAASAAVAARPTALPAQAAVGVVVKAGKPVNSFRPDEALGAGVDGHEKGENARIYTRESIEAMRSAGLRPLSYRLRTELGIEAWHWNPAGQWSDAGKRQGYWTSDARTGRPISLCYGYRLPRRGSTIDQANDDGYSRLDDGDARTFWKSNPYLDHYYTHEPNDRLPQWVVVDLGARLPVNAVRILWGVPFATRYEVQAFEGDDAIQIDEENPGAWRPFPTGAQASGKGGETLHRLGPRPAAVRFLRVRLLESSGTAPAGAADVRDRLGYAIRELSVGTVDGAGRFHDLVKHRPARHGQTVMYASSTDPWHRASDLDTRVEQPGFDRVYGSGLTFGLPVLIPVPLLYDTPENSAAEIRYLRARGYAIRGVELGEEPDGQFAAPEDYAALYAQFAAALHWVDPRLKLGGPCFQSTIHDVKAWPETPGNDSWMRRFVTHLRSRGREGDFQFFSMEWYPFDDTRAATAPQLAKAPGLLAGVLRRLQRDGLSSEVPWMITEYGYSSFSGRPEVDIEGALFNADLVGQFLTLGGDAAYLYGYEPNELIEELPGAWGQNMLFQWSETGGVRHRMATYHGARLVSQQWVQPGHGVHQLFSAAADVRTAQGEALVTAYAVHRPDGLWALLLLNKDPSRTIAVRVRMGNRGGLAGPADLFQYSRAQYRWHADRDRGYPSRELPPVHTRFRATPDSAVSLPPYSLSVVRAAGPPDEAPLPR